MMIKIEKRSPVAWRLLVVFAIVFLILAGAGYHYYVRERKKIDRETYNLLHTIATYKAEQIVNWRQERINDIYTISNNPTIFESLNDYIHKEDSEEKPLLLQWMKSLEVHFDYRQVYIVSPQEKLLLHSMEGPQEVHQKTKALLKEARESGKVIFSPLHTDEKGHVHIGMIAPIFDKKEALVSYLVLEINPNKFLFPLIQSSTMPGKSGESILIRVQDSAIMFLSELRFRRNAILEQYKPESEQSIFHSIINGNINGLLHGKGYRDKKVLAVVEHLEGTAWFIVSKSDAEELYAPFRRNAVQIAIILSLILLVVGAVIYIIWRRQNYKYYQHQLKLEKERSTLLKQYNDLSRAANDSIIMLDEKGRITEANEKALGTYGYELNEMLSMPISHILASDNYITDFTNALMQSSNGALFESQHIKKDGTIFPVEVSSRPVEVEDRTYSLLIIRDISDRKKVEEQLRVQKAYFEDLFEYAPDAIAILDNHDRIIQLNREFQNLFGFSSKEAAGKQINDLIVPEEHVGEGVELTNKVADGKSIELETVRMAKDGTRIPVAITGKPIRLEGDQLAVYGIYRNIEEKKRSEEKLKLLTQFARENPNPVLTINDQGEIIYANKGADPLLSAWNTQVNEKAPEDIVYHVLQSLKKNDQAVIETSIGKFHFLLSLSPNQKAGRVHIYASDITERKYAGLIREVMYNIAHGTNITQNLPELLNIIRIELDKLIDTTNFFIVMYDPKTDNLSLPYIRDQKDSFEVFPAGRTLSAYVINKRAAVLLRKDEIYRLEKEGIVELVGTPSKVWLGVPLIVDNEVIGVVVVQDYDDENSYTEKDLETLNYISSQIAVSVRNKSIEEEVRKLSVSVEQSPVSVIITNTKGQIEYVNPKFTQLTGYTFQEVYLRNPRLLKSGLTPDEEYKKLWQTINSGKEWKGEFKNKRKNGELFWVSSSISPIKAKNGSIHHFVAINEDITDRKEMEADLIEAKEKAEESDRLKSAFLATMSHELRTPLNAVIGFSELIDETLTEDEVFEYAGNINRSGKHLLEIIEDLFNISIIESGDVEIEKKEFNLNKLLDEIHMNIKTEQVNFERENLEIELRKALPDSECQVNSDPGFIKQIFQNLLKNALKFTEHGYIEYGYTLESQDTLRFYVKDTGIGIAKDKQDIIFERFRQADEGFTRKYEGTGLGLSISKRLVELLSGRIWVRSELDNGSVFYFTLPYEPTEKEAIQEETYRRFQWPDKRILIAEDDESNYLLLESMLKKTGIKLQRAHDGRHAVEIYEKYSKENESSRSRYFDLILMDIKMPIMGGYEATRKIKQIDPDATVIAQTAFAMKGDEEKALNAGCDDYVTKPIRKDALLRKMDQYLSGKS